jgi:hypothetical protein
MNQDTIKQLVYKRYVSGLTEMQKLIGMDPYLIYNNDFYKQQILNEVACVGTPADALDRIKYVRPHLVKIFEEFNKCN